MATATVVALVVGALATVLTAVLVVLVLTQRVLRAVRDAAHQYERIQPALERLQADGQVTRRELDRLQASLEALRTTRGSRPSPWLNG